MQKVLKKLTCDLPSGFESMDGITNFKRDNKGQNLFTTTSDRKLGISVISRGDMAHNRRG